MLNKSNIIDKIRLPFRKEKELFSALYRVTGLYPRNIKYYKTALMHKSMRSRNEKGKPVNNERLEFLGDAVLDAVVGDIVFQHFPGKREGFLTNTRSKLVARETLGKLACEMGIDQLVMMAGDVKSHHNNFVNGNAFEALVGAIYLDRGYNACMKFMQKRILQHLINIDKVAYKEVNFKSKLLEWCQKNRVNMEFTLLRQTTEGSNSPVFECQAVIEGVKGAIGKGYTKKESQQLAAKETLRRLRREPQFIDEVFAAKGNRTKMEESPVSVAPDPEESKTDFIIPSKTEDAKTEIKSTWTKTLKDNGTKAPQAHKSKKSSIEDEVFDKDFDLSDITAMPKEESREDIIAAAEAKAFSEAG